MLFADSISKEVAHLQKDASRVARDVGRLSEQLTRAGRDKTTDTVRSVASDTRRRFRSLGGNLRDVSQGAQVYAKRLDATLRDRPYHVACATLCVGFAIGTLVPMAFRKR